jgi:protoporphyrinogen oxidase
MNDNSDDTHHVVIVGGGIAGLMAAHELLLLVDNIKVTIVEACDTLGGRIRGNTTFVPHHVTDIGAEYMHGTKTLLTDLVKELSETKRAYQFFVKRKFSPCRNHCDLSVYILHIFLLLLV